MTGYSIQFTDISTSTTTGLATQVLFSAFFFSRKPTKPMGTGSLAVFLLCILCKIFCRLHVGGKLWAAKCHPKRACGLNIALLIFKMYITLKPVVISNTFLMLPYLGKTVKEHGKKHVKWVKEHSQEPRSHGAKIIPIFLQSTGPHVRQVCAVIFVSCGTRRAKDKVKIP